MRASSSSSEATRRLRDRNSASTLWSKSFAGERNCFSSTSSKNLSRARAFQADFLHRLAKQQPVFSLLDDFGLFCNSGHGGNFRNFFHTVDDPYSKELLAAEISAILKEQINRRLAELGYDKILVSNTSGISITRLGAAYGKPDRFMGMHFMNPVPMQKGVEIIRGLATSEATYSTIVALCHDLDKIEIPAEDKAGFAINRMFVPFVNEAVRVIEEGIAGVEDVDKCTYCLGHKMGPLMTADFVGLDTTYYIANIMFDEYKEPQYAPPPLLKRMVLAGRLGRKSGRGFYDYSKA